MDEASPLILSGVCDNENFWVFGEQGPRAEGGCPAGLCDAWQPLRTLEPLPVRVDQGHNRNGHPENAAQLHRHTCNMLGDLHFHLHWDRWPQHVYFMCHQSSKLSLCTVHVTPQLLMHACAGQVIGCLGSTASGTRADVQLKLGIEPIKQWPG